MKKKILIIVFSHLIFFSLTAQTSDFGLWTTVGVKNQIGKWDLKANTQLRTFDNFSQIRRWSIKLDAAYKIAKPIKVGINYKYIYFNDTKYSDFQPRQIYAGYIQGKLKLGKIKISLREQCQRTIKDESDRTNGTSYYDSYKINPEWYWRNKIDIAYNIPKFPITPSLSFESYYQLNNPDGNTFDNLRYKLNFEYNASNHHAFSLYGLIDNEINIEDPVNTFITGIKYIYSF